MATGSGARGRLAVWLAGLVLAAALLACGGSSDWAGWDFEQDAYTCPAGQTLGFEHSKGAAVCWR